MLKCKKDCLNLHSSTFGIFFDQSQTKSASKIFVLVVSEILRPFVNMTPDEKYYLSVKARV